MTMEEKHIAKEILLKMIEKGSVTQYSDVNYNAQNIEEVGKLYAKILSYVSSKN